MWLRRCSFFFHLILLLFHGAVVDAINWSWIQCWVLPWFQPANVTFLMSRHSHSICERVASYEFMIFFMRGRVACGVDCCRHRDGSCIACIAMLQYVVLCCSMVNCDATYWVFCLHCVLLYVTKQGCQWPLLSKGYTLKSTQFFHFSFFSPRLPWVRDWGSSQGGSGACSSNSMPVLANLAQSCSKRTKHDVSCSTDVLQCVAVCAVPNKCVAVRCSLCLILNCSYLSAIYAGKYNTIQHTATLQYMQYNMLQHCNTCNIIKRHMILNNIYCSYTRIHLQKTWHTHTHTHTHRDVNTRTHAHTHTHAHTWTHTLSHTNTLSYSHTCIHIQKTWYRPVARAEHLLCSSYEVG